LIDRCIEREGVISQVPTAVSSYIPILILVRDATITIGPAEIAQDSSPNRTSHSGACDICVRKVYRITKAVAGGISRKTVEIVGKDGHLRHCGKCAETGCEQKTGFFHRARVLLQRWDQHDSISSESGSFVMSSKLWT